MTEPRWLTPPEDAAWRGYRRMAGLLQAAINRDLAHDSGLSEPDYDVLSLLSETEGHRWRMTEMATRLLWSKSRLSHHLSRMAQRGLVTREDCGTDGRGTEVVLTDAGMAAIVAAAPDHVESVRRHFIDHLTAEEMATLTTLTTRLITHLTTP